MEDILYVKIKQLEKYGQICENVERDLKRVYDDITRDIINFPGISKYLTPNIENLNKIKNINDSKDTEKKYSRYIFESIKLYKLANNDVKKCCNEILKLSVASANIKMSDGSGVRKIEIDAEGEGPNSTLNDNESNIIKNKENKVQNTPYDIKDRVDTKSGRKYSLYNQLMEGYRQLENEWTGQGICVPSSIATLLSGFNIFKTQHEVIQALNSLELDSDIVFRRMYEGNKFLGICYYNLHAKGYNINDSNDRKKHADSIWEHMLKGYPVAVSKSYWHNVELDDGKVVLNQTADHAIVFIDYRIKKEGNKEIRQVRISDSWDIDGIDNDAWVDLDYFVNNHVYSYMLVDDNTDEDSIYYFDGWYNENGEYFRRKAVVHAGDYGESVKDKVEFDIVASNPNYGSDPIIIEDYEPIRENEEINNRFKKGEGELTDI